ncbi:MAG: SDR family NAD(P)-dependent oxidoreductase [Actinocatenispora sp.]
MDGKTVLITGATTGLGRSVALHLAARGATVLLHGRDQARLDQTAEEVGRRAPAVRTYRADLADLDQVRALAQQVLAVEPRLDVLVNNAAAGGGADPEHREVSRQGHELRLAVNHLAPHLLTRLLLPLLAPGARVVNVASMGQAPVDLDDLMMTRDYEGVRAYCRSKLAMIMATFDLAEEVAGLGVTVNALHPAHLMDTPLVRQSGLTPEASVAEGAAPTVRLIADPALASVTGRYFEQYDDVPAHAQAYDATARSRLASATRSLLAPWATPIRAALATDAARRGSAAD